MLKVQDVIPEATATGFSSPRIMGNHLESGSWFHPLPRTKKEETVRRHSAYVTSNISPGQGAGDAFANENMGVVWNCHFRDTACAMDQTIFVLWISVVFAKILIDFVSVGSRHSSFALGLALTCHFKTTSCRQKYVSLQAE